MSNHCERCGTENKTIYMTTVVNSNGEGREVFLCTDCYEQLNKTNGFLITGQGPVWRRDTFTINKSQNIPCTFCGATDGIHIETQIKDNNGRIINACLCSACVQNLRYENEPVDSESSLSASPRTVVNNVVDTSTSSGWTRFLKTINIVCAVIITIAGFIIGANIADAVSYNDGDVVLGSLLGGVIGLIVGLISIALSMVIAEISDTLKDIRDELRNKK